jgi:cyclophilin family peptidyl-prolyl cis-trans isomerase
MEQEQPKSKKTIYIVVGIILLVAAAYFIFDRKSGGPAAILQQNQPIVSSVQNQPDNSALSVSQTQTASSSQSAIKNNMHKITIETNYGTIEFTTYDADAPNTVKKFIDLADKGFYDNLTFHRVIDGFMIQGGDPLGNGTGGPGYTFADELNPAADSYKAGYIKGVVAMANAGPNTNGSQFFIMVADYALKHDYTIFGKVTKGQEVADKIAKVAKDTNDKPLTPVVMKKVTVKANQ